MLMFGGEAKPPALGNFYYSPLRLRPVLESRIHSDLPMNPVKRRQKKESTLDLEMDLQPTKSRHSPREVDVNNDNPSEEDSSLAKVNRDTGDESEDEEEAPKPTKKKKHRKNKKKDRGSEGLEQLCRKMRVSYILIFLGVLILVVCGCALYLRNRLVACCKRCWPFKKRNKKSNKDMFDVEGGDSPFLSRRSFKSKKKGAAATTVDTGVPDSRTSLTKSQENGKVGCSPCCRKKKKKKDKKRRK